MADIKKNILVQVEIDRKRFAVEAAKAKEELAGLIAKHKELAAAAEQSKKMSEAEATALAALSLKMGWLANDIQRAVQVLTNFAQQTKSTATEAESLGEGVQGLNAELQRYQSYAANVQTVLGSITNELRIQVQAINAYILAFTKLNTQVGITTQATGALKSEFATLGFDTTPVDDAIKKFDGLVFAQVQAGQAANRTVVQNIALRGELDAVTQAIADQGDSWRNNTGDIDYQSDALIRLIEQRNVLNETVEKGGDMGKINTGMLTEAISELDAQVLEVIDTFSQVPVSIQEVNDRITVLQAAQLIAPIDQVNDFTKAILILKGGLLELDLKELENSYKGFNTVVDQVKIGVQSLTMIGADQAKVEEVLTKITQAQTIATNLYTVAKTGLILAQKANLAGVMQNISAQAAYTLVMGGSTNAMKLFRIALASTGLGAIALLVATLILNFDKVKNAVMGFIEKNVVLKAALDAIVQPIKTLWEGLKKVAEFLGLAATEQEKQRDAMVAATDDEVAALENKYDKAIELARAEGKDTTQLEQDKLKAVLNRIDMSMKALEAKAKAEGKLGEAELAKFRELEGQKKDILHQMNVQQAQQNTKQREDQKKADEEATRRREQDAADRKRRGQERANDAKKLNDELVSIEKGFNDEKKTAYQRDVDNINEKYNKLEQRARGNAQIMLKIEKYRQTELKKAQEEENKRKQDEENRLDIAESNVKITKIQIAAKKEADTRINALKNKQAQELSQEGLSETQKEELKRQHADQMAALQLEIDKKALADAQAIHQEKLKMLYEQHLIDMNNSDLGVREKDIKKKEYENATQEATDEFNAKQQEAKDSISTREKERADAEANLVKKAEDTKKNSYQSSLDALIQVSGKKSVIGKAAFLAQKALTISEIKLNLKDRTNAILTSAEKEATYLSAIPFVGGFLATARRILGKVQVGMAIAETAKEITSAAGITVPGFKRGGTYWSDGRGATIKGPGTGTSDSINARLSDGEAVINARSTAMFGPQLNAINMAGGGRSLFNNPAISGGVAHFAVGGVFDGGVSANYQTPSVDYREIGQAVGSALVSNFPEVWVNVTDISRSQDRVAKVDERISY